MGVHILCYSHNGDPQSNFTQQPRINFLELWANLYRFAIVSISDPNIVVGEKNATFIDYELLLLLYINDDDNGKVYE